jgi:periplasmic divalent cation tolerance protein
MSARGVRGQQVIVVLVTCPTSAVARRMARHLVRQRLCACVNVLPRVESVFSWNGKIERCHELLLLIKTTAGRFEALRRAVVQRHPYEVPEIIALPLRTGHRPYVEWIRKEAT